MEDIKLWMKQHLQEHVDTVTNKRVAWSLAFAAIREFRPSACDAFEYFNLAREVSNENS